MLLHLVMKAGFVIVCGFVLNRGSIAMYPERAVAKGMLNRHKFFFIGMLIGVIFLVSDMYYTLLYT